MRIVEAFLAVPSSSSALLALVCARPVRLTVIVVIGIVFTPMVARTVRAAVLASVSSNMCRPLSFETRRSPYVMFGEILPNVTAPIMVEITVRLGYAIFTVASFLSSASASSRRPDWGADISENYGCINGGELVDGPVSGACNRKPGHRRST